MFFTSYPLFDSSKKNKTTPYHEGSGRYVLNGFVMQTVFFPSVLQHMGVSALLEVFQLCLLPFKVTKSTELHRRSGILMVRVLFKQVTLNMSKQRSIASAYDILR